MVCADFRVIIFSQYFAPVTVFKTAVIFSAFVALFGVEISTLFSIFTMFAVRIVIFTAEAFLVTYTNLKAMIVHKALAVLNRYIYS